MSEEQANQVQLTAGEQLRHTREQKNLSVTDVASQLNLEARIIEAIEANDFDALPNAVFTRGYIRGYARLLELDSDPLVAEYPDDPSLTTEQEPVVAGRVAEMVRQYPQWVLGGAGVIGAVLLISVVVWLWPGDDPDAIEPLAEAAAPTTVMPTTASSAPAAATATPASESVAASAGASASAPRGSAEGGTSDAGLLPAESQPSTSTSSATAEPEPLAEAAALVDAAAPTASSEAAPVAAEQAAALASGDRLSFSFTEECWVEVEAADGRTIYSNIRRSGQTLELGGQAPFKILLGYAPGVSLTFNGEPVALAPHTRNNVANLVLGQ